jgi:hypothetical protein
MEYYCYEDAFYAVVQDNDGILPDLHEVFDFIMYCRPSNLVGPLTVAEIVTYALLEVSAPRVSSPVEVHSIQHVAAAPVAGELLYLDKLLDQAVASLN